MKNDKTALLETMPVGKALMTMAIPTLVSQLITLLYRKVYRSLQQEAPA